MNTLILLAALSSQITFKTSQQENMTTIIPQVTWRSRVIVRFRLFLCDKGRGDKVRPDSKIPFLYPLIRRLI
jgi:curli production protein